MPVHAGERGAENFGPLYNPVGSVPVDHLPMKTAPRQIVAFGGGGLSMEVAITCLGDRGVVPAAPIPEALSTAVAA